PNFRFSSPPLTSHSRLRYQELQRLSSLIRANLRSSSQLLLRKIGTVMSIADRICKASASVDASSVLSTVSLEEIANEATTLAAGPHAPLIADLLAHRLNSIEETGLWRDALHRFTVGLAAQRSYLALREAVDCLLTHDIIDIVGPTL